MPTYKITGPDGKSYNVTGDSPEGAYKALETRLGGQASAGNQYQPNASDAFLNSAWQAATLGFGDELVAGGLVPFEMASRAIKGEDWSPGAAYDATLAEQRRQIADAEKNHPIANIGGSVAGALTGLKALGPIVSSPFSANVAANAPMWQKVAAGVGDGFGMGMAYGYGSGEGVKRDAPQTWEEWAYGIPSDVGARLSNALPTAAAGGVVGGLAPVVGAGAGKAYEAFRNSRAAAPIAKTVGASPEALRMIGDLGQADMAFNGPGAANIAAAGPEGMLADAGPSMSQYLKTSIQNSGPAARLATERVNERVSRDSDALVSALDTYMGKPEGLVRAQNDIRAGSRPQVNAAYETAYNTPIDYASEAGKQVEDIIGRIPGRFAKRAIERANERMVYDGTPGKQILAEVADDGTVSFREMPNVMQADYIKKGLDDVVREGTDPVTGKLSPDAQFAAQIAKDLRGAVSDAVPEYRAALETAADPLSRQEAIRTGYTLLSPSVTRDQAELAIGGMTKPERDALAQGIRSHFDDVMANVTRTAADDDVGAREALKAVKDLSSRSSREKLEMALGKDSADALLTEVDRVAKSFNLRSKVAQRSDTFANFSMNQRVSDQTAPGPITKAMRGEGISAGKGVIQSITGETDAALRARNDAIYAEIADILTRRGVDAPAIYSAIQRLGQTDAKTSAVNAAIARALSGPQISYPSSIAASQLQQR